MRVLCELREFLLLAYTRLQLLSQAFCWKNWRWCKWILDHTDEINVIVSFNYDAIIEWVLAFYGMRECRYIISYETKHAAPPVVFKPHGSTNFGAPISYMRTRYSYLNDMPIQVEGISYEKSKAVGIVLPAEYSKIKGYQYVKPGFEAFEERAPFFTHCLCVGLSYWECDREEINRLISALSSETRFVVVNPRPSEDLMSFVREKFSHVYCYGDGPPSCLP